MRLLPAWLLLARAAVAGPVEDAADRALAALRAKADLSDLAAKDDPDPWMVADELCARGEFDAAEAFAKAAPRKATEKLPAYAAARRGKTDDAAARAAANAARAPLEAKDWAGALRAIEGGTAPAGCVSEARLAHWRGLALYQLRRLEEAAAAFGAAAECAERLGWLRKAAATWEMAARSATERSDPKLALTLWERRLAVADALGDRQGAADAHGWIGSAHLALGECDKAQELQERALRLHGDLADRAGIARDLGNLGMIRSVLDDPAGALGFYERALEGLDDRGAVATTLGNIGILHFQLGDLAKALETQERALALRQALGDPGEIATSLAGLALVRTALGEYVEARGLYERARELTAQIGDRGGTAANLGYLAGVHAKLGDYAKALDCREQALELRKQTGNPRWIAADLVGMGSLHHSLGDYAAALAYDEQALALYRDIGDDRRVARTLVNIGAVRVSMGDFAKALEIEEQALEIMERLDDREGIAGALANIAGAHQRLGEPAKALPYDLRALKLMRQIGKRESVAQLLWRVGVTHRDLRDTEKALDCFEQSRALAAELGTPDAEVLALIGLASVHHARREPRQAIERAREAIRKMPLLVGNLAESTGAYARERLKGAFDAGALAALDLDDVAQVSFFLESGRAMTLLESLGGRERAASFAVPEELRKAEAEARAAEASALSRYRRDAALQGEWEGARGNLLSVARRIQREAKAQAAVVYPEAAPLDRIQAALREGEALVTYAALPDVVALVVTRDVARVVRLGGSDAIAEASAKLDATLTRNGTVRGVRPPTTDDPAEAAETAATRLRALVVDPLGLGAETKRLLVAPHGDLAYVPFALLAPDREIVYVPSGTAYEQLLLSPARGVGVLAIGDPPAGDVQAATVFGGDLGPLPGSRAEAHAVGDKVLVGAEATETGFLSAVRTRERWRAVHLACHGLARADMPDLSALALGADAKNDGYLTVLEVLGLRVPADLVVLSACETARGKIYRAEGVIGLARAFMVAGAPRVLVSPWKVDDEATRALMEKFYEAWKPGKMGAAAALRAAQEHVRSQEKWKHPYFWAAWQLWGLPE